MDFIWLLLYGYYMEQMGTLQKGWGRRAVLLCLSAGCLLLSRWLGGALPWLGVSLLFVLYDLFFDEESFRRQWWRAALPGLCFFAAALLPDGLRFAANGPVLFVLFCFLAAKREYLRPGNGLLMAAMYSAFSAFLLWADAAAAAFGGGSLAMLQWGCFGMELLLLATVEGTLFSYQKGFFVQTEQFQKDVMGHQYEEIKSIYMNMRGWRHDYHNHLQVMKAQLTLGNLEETCRYLDELERDLDRVDTYVKSGNLMVDAILNSKLSLAQQKQIAVNCKAKVPEKIEVEDVDLCVILGNLLDNALEACEQIPPMQRFLRVYMVVNKSQLYLSVQNAAKEELDFNEKNYITSKRGNHGFGMKRVQTMVDKYEGFLNLANEPGIFAAEVTLPLPSV